MGGCSSFRPEISNFRAFSEVLASLQSNENFIIVFYRTYVDSVDFIDGTKLLLKFKPHKEDVTPIYLLIKYSHLNESKHLLRCLNMRFA